MGITWRQRLVQQPELSNINQWPLVDTKSLSKKAKRNYHRNLTIVSEVLAGKKRMCEIAKSNGVSPSHLSKLMSRCLSGPEEEPPPLSRALIPYKHLNKNHRRTELSRLSESKGGACAFSYLIQEVPGLQHHLDTMIKGSVKRFRSGQNLTITALHAAFIRYLEDKNWPRDTYPFTEISRGYESLRQYLIKKTTEYCTPKTSGRRIPASRTPLRIFSEIQIDSQMIDCNGSVALELNDQFESLRLSRVTLIQARDTATGCTLAFNIALTTHPSADDILTLFEKMTQEWQPIQLKTKGLSYNPGACLPSTLHPNFRRPAFGIIRMDNAFAHIAHSVRQIVCHQLHATLNFGIPAQPKSRNVIEQAFSLLNYPIHRFPSTTGSHPQDEKKEHRKNLRKAPILSMLSLEEAISVIIANNNLRKLANMGAICPLDQARYQMESHLIPLRPKMDSIGTVPFWSHRMVYVRKPKKDLHSPRINFEKVVYRGAAINNPELVDRQVLVHFDRRDIRVLKVYSLDGVYFGDVKAARTWMRFPHSVTTRKYINELIRKDRIDQVDPLGGYFCQVLNRRENPKEALEVLRLAREFGFLIDPKSNEETGTSNEKGSPEDPNRDADRDRSDIEDELKKIPDWSPEMVKNRKW